jgi:glycosyltransferase involved in cell wall biosynthesis
MRVKPLVSVLIPTYNRAELVCQAIDSVRAQSHPHVQIIVVDDGSTDDTVERLRDMPDVLLLTDPGPRGPGAARNAALARAIGTFVAPLDADDLWESCFLERSVAALDELKLDFVFSNWTHERGGASYLDQAVEQFAFDPPKVDFNEWRVLAPETVRRWFLRACPAPSSSLVVRRTSMPTAWNEHMLIGDDYYFMVEMVLQGATRAAFTETSRWTKRIDGMNRYESLTGAELYRKEVLDRRRLIVDFGSRLSLAERARWELLALRSRAQAARQRSGRHAALATAHPEVRDRDGLTSQRRAGST